MIDWLEIQFWKVAKWLIRRGYGADCETRDTEDFKDMPDNWVVEGSRCGSCRAREIIEWIDDHIKLIKM